MKVSNAEAWKKCCDYNRDAYGAACVRYAEAWANLMELRMAEGKPLKDVAELASYDADTEGITMFMYGIAVNILAAAWEHGEELLRWHNLDKQIGNEWQA